MGASGTLCVSVDDNLRFPGFCFSLLAAAFVSPARVESQSLDGTPVPCKGQMISRIEISSRPPFEVKGSGFQRRFARYLTDLHATTNPSVISRFLVIRAGMPCSELRRQESERILRTQPYLSDATVTAYPDDRGGVYLGVVTVDEVSIVLGGGGSGSVPYVRSFRLGEENLMGEAVSVVANWRYSENFRDTYSAQIIDYQFLGRRHQLKLEGERHELGGTWGIELSHPFLTDLQRVSWRTTAGSRESYRYFKSPDDDPAVLLQRSYADAGGVVRIGPPGKLALLGGSVSYEDEMPQSFPTLIGTGTTERDTTGQLVGRYERHRVTRLNALAGIRDVKYLRVRGFESLDGIQDIRQGFELAALIGRGIPIVDGSGRDMFASANIYAGAGSPSAFAAAEGTIEGRRASHSERWDGVLGSGRFATYLKPATRHTLLTSLEWSGGWKQRIPFQLSFSDRRGGPRGYEKSYLAGGRRAVLRVEDRIFVGHVKQFASVGVAPFVDFGKLWAGDVPFGVNTRVHASAGISLLASLPPRSRRMWRMDIVYPLERGSGARLRLGIVGRDFTRIFWNEPGDVRRNRERSLPTSIFNWP